MFYLVSDDYKVVGICPSLREVYGAVLNVARTRYQANPVMVRSFEDILNPEGVYITRVDHVYVIKSYKPNHGYILSNYEISTTLVYVCEFSQEQRSKLKPPSYLQAVQSQSWRAPEEVKPLTLKRM